MENLRKTSMRNTGSSSQKFRLPCKDRLNPTAKDWLDTIESIDAGVLKGILDQHKEVIIKCGTPEVLESDYKYSEFLTGKGIPNTIKYYCFFTCKHNINELGTMCNQNGPLIGAILMPYYSLGSIMKYTWNVNNFHILKSVLKQVCCALLNAYETTGFCHRDLHPGNVILRYTKKKKIVYNDQIEIETNGVYAMMIDFEKAAFSSHIMFLYEDIKRIVFNSCCSVDNSDLFLDVDLSMLNRLNNKAVDKYVYKSVLEMIENITIRAVKSKLNTLNFADF